LYCSTSFAATILGDYPICTAEDDARAFGQAKMFNKYDEMEDFISSGKCIFVEPDIKTTIIDRAIYYKVLVFKPYGNPIKGWTDVANIRQ
jgi:hypothetical protein